MIIKHVRPIVHIIVYIIYDICSFILYLILQVSFVECNLCACW